MGMYTGLRGTIVLNDLGVRVAVSDFNWESFTNVKQLVDFSEDNRAYFIPNGVHCYMPEEWGDSFVNVHGSVMHFSCSLKNYTGTIEKFIQNVLPVIADEWVLESLYEEDEVATTHKRII